MAPADDGQDGLVLLGAECSYCADIADTMEKLGRKVLAAVYFSSPRHHVSCAPAFVSFDDLPDHRSACPAVCAEIVPGRRSEHVKRAHEFGFRDFPVIVDPSSVVSPHAILERGCYVNALSLVKPHAELGRFVLVGSHSSVGHHTRLADFCTLGPGVTIASHCAIERGAFIGTGAKIAPSVAVGANSVVGAGAVVIKDVPANCVVVGNPARIIRENNKGYGGTGV